MELMSEDCKLQFSQAAGQTKGFREVQGKATELDTAA